jgi:hypothetical protein
MSPRGPSPHKRATRGSAPSAAPARRWRRGPRRESPPGNDSPCRRRLPLSAALPKRLLGTKARTRDFSITSVTTLPYSACTSAFAFCALMAQSTRRCVLEACASKAAQAARGEGRRERRDTAMPRPPATCRPCLRGETRAQVDRGVRGCVPPRSAVKWGPCNMQLLRARVDRTAAHAASAVRCASQCVAAAHVSGPGLRLGRHQLSRGQAEIAYAVARTLVGPRSRLIHGR